MVSGTDKQTGTITFGKNNSPSAKKTGNKEICLFDIEFGEIEIDDKYFSEAKELVNNYWTNE